MGGSDDLLITMQPPTRKQLLGRSLFRTLARDERGVALVFAVMFAMLLLTVAGTVTYASVAGTHHADRSNADQTAYALAEAGINNALSILHNPSNSAHNPNLLPPSSSPRTEIYPTGRIVWWGVLDLNAKIWTITSAGYVPNPVGPQHPEVKRTVVAEIHVGSSLTSPPNSPAWNYVLISGTGDPDGCDMEISNSATWYPQLFVMGNLCLDNTAQILDGPLLVKGQLSLANQARVGASNKPINEAHIAGGCKLDKGPVRKPCSAADQVFATILDDDPTSVTPPVADFPGWYDLASPGPKNPCQSVSGIVPAFDNNGVRDNSLGVLNLTPATSYSCATDRGSIAWDAPTRTLTVAGTIYIDGSAMVANGLLNQYNGQATLYLSGTFLMEEQNKLCAGIANGACDFAQWNPNAEMLVVVADGAGGQNKPGIGIQHNDSTRFQGAYYATKGVWMGQSVQWEGPMIANNLYVQNSVRSYDFPLIYQVPAGMPGNPTVYAKPAPPVYLG